MDSDRIWHDPQISIGHQTYDKDKLFAAYKMYDSGNRRWYRFEIFETLGPNIDGMCSLLARHIREYHERHDRAPSWYTICKASSERDPTFENRPDHLVSEPTHDSIMHPVFYNGDSIPATSIDTLSKLSYFDVKADRCAWAGNWDCIFMRIQHKEDNHDIRNEIRVRETLYEAMGQRHGAKAS